MCHFEQRIDVVQVHLPQSEHLTWLWVELCESEGENRSKEEVILHMVDAVALEALCVCLVNDIVVCGCRAFVVIVGIIVAIKSLPGQSVRRAMSNDLLHA